MASPLAPTKPIPGVTNPPGYKPNPNGKNPGDWGYDSIGTPYLPNGTTFTGLGGGNPNAVIPNPVQTVNNIGDFLGKLSNVYLWKRIGIVAVGVLLIWYGVLIFLSTNKKIQGAVTSTAKKVISKTPEGAAANVATGAVGL
jgi:hypothetical protein